MTWFWRQPEGRITYKPEHVNIWADMVRRNLSMPHRIACVTDIPNGIDPSIDIITPPRDFEDATIPTWGPARPQCLRRLAMFSPNAGAIFGQRFVCMDMDCVIAGPLDSLFETDAEFKIYNGTAPDRLYNGSMMLLKAGARAEVYNRFTVKDAALAGRRFVGSDQAWISHILGAGQPTWGPKDGVNWWDRSKSVPAETRLMFFPGYFKPWQFVETVPDEWVSKHYRRTPHGRSLILGYADTVWDELEAALETGPFDAVIASPEAAEHWPGEILAIAEDDQHAEKLAVMHGLTDAVWCGRQAMAV
ncbi:hypothetical protein LB523_12080 [Mesorhizobium sp. ESP-6-4]|nr:hypothetical protein [Mesorhizobium sp. ESP-6-4]